MIGVIKQSFSKAIESLQEAIEIEAKSKTEAVRIKKKLEVDVVDIETNIEYANATNVETQKTIQKILFQVKEAQEKVNQESQVKSSAEENLVQAERKCTANRNALEEAKSLLDQVDRNRRIAEQELADANEELSEGVVLNQATLASKRRLEHELSALEVSAYKYFIHKMIIPRPILMICPMKSTCLKQRLRKSW